MSSGLRSFLAIVLSMGVLILWYTVIAPPPPPTAPPTPSASPETQQVEKSAAPAPDRSRGQAPAESQKDIRVPKGEEILLENRHVSIRINTDGGVITQWILKDYTRNGEGQVSLAEPGGRILEMEGGTFAVERKSAAEAELTARHNGQRIIRRFRLKENSYQLELEIEVKNLAHQTASFQPALTWGKQAVEESPQRGVLFFKTPPDRWHPVAYKEGALLETLWERVPVSEKKEGAIDWIGAQSRYFLGALIPVDQRGSALDVGKYRLESGEDFFVQSLNFSPAQILPGERWVQKFLIYGGPKDYKRLKTIVPGLEKTLGLGWTTLVAVPMLYLLKFFYNLIHNYGIAIILLTVLVKLLLNPINRKSLASMKGMQALQPRLKELREKNANDKQKLNQEMMQLFKNHKINPMGGCLPMLLQIPIYIALYKVLWSSVELYHAPFFWFYKDLSAPDPYLVTPLLLGITMFIQTKMTPTATVDPMQQKMMMLMPLMFCVFMVFLPMGLGLYILVNTLMTILQQWMYRKEIRFRDLILRRA